MQMRVDLTNKINNVLHQEDVKLIIERWSEVARLNEPVAAADDIDSKESAK